MSSVKLTRQQYSLYHLKCGKLLQEPELRFAGIIDKMGNLIAGGFKKGLPPLVEEADRRKMYMELVLRVSTRMEFDYCLGPVKYSASKREKAIMLSFPIGNIVLFVGTQPDVKIEETAEKIMKIFSMYF